MEKRAKNGLIVICSYDYRKDFGNWKKKFGPIRICTYDYRDMRAYGKKEKFRENRANEDAFYSRVGQETSTVKRKNGKEKGEGKEEVFSFWEKFLGSFLGEFWEGILKEKGKGVQKFLSLFGAFWKRKILMNLGKDC